MLGILIAFGLIIGACVVSIVLTATRGWEFLEEPDDGFFED